ncbi:MAG: hypothetical protein AB7N54_02930 [Alphaproteobacteria bacterium]
MLKFALALIVALPLAGPALAQGTTPAPATPVPPVQVQPYPGLTPSDLMETKIDGYRMLAIAAGAVGGAIVTNIVIGGVVSPVLMAGGVGGLGGASALVHGVAVVAGGIAGGYFGDWLYTGQ